MLPGSRSNGVKEGDKLGRVHKGVHAIVGAQLNQALACAPSRLSFSKVVLDFGQVDKGLFSALRSLKIREASEASYVSAGPSEIAAEVDLKSGIQIMHSCCGAWFLNKGRRLPGRTAGESGAQK